MKALDIDETFALHVIPVFPGERRHTESILCWCDPRVDIKNPRILVHNRKAEA